jgi:hypothetical protein
MFSVILVEYKFSGVNYNCAIVVDLGGCVAKDSLCIRKLVH